MIGLLRFVGLINAALWFGAMVFFTFWADPIVTSEEMRGLIGQNNFPYFSTAISQLLATGFFRLYVVCSLVALLHLAAEWLYLGKYPKRLWLSLVLGLLVLGVFQAYALQPRLREWHRAEFARSEPRDSSGRALREAAARAFRTWHAVSRGLDVVLVAGVGIYLWRVGNPSDPARFVSTAKFRG